MYVRSGISDAINIPVLTAFTEEVAPADAVETGVKGKRAGSHEYRDCEDGVKCFYGFVGGNLLKRKG